MKKILKTIVFSTIFISLHTLASDHQGVITATQIHSGLPNKVCFSIKPAVEGGNPWVCLIDTTPQYDKIYALLLTSYASKKQCMFSWTEKDPQGNPNVNVVTCY